MAIENIAADRVPYKQSIGRAIQADHGAFDHITRDSAYWVGFLMADGCIVDDAIVLQLKASDRCHVAKFRTFLKSAHKLSTTPPQAGGGGSNVSHGGARISVGSHRMTAALATFGVVPRKSSNARVLLLERNHDFWRGMIDGDGHIGVYNRGARYPTVYYPKIGLSGSPAILSQFREYVSAALGVSSPAPVPNHSIGSVTLGAKMTVALLRILYTDAPTALARKRILATTIIDEFGHLQFTHRPRTTTSKMT